MDNVFPNASEARAGARNNSLIYAEIRAIETKILTAIDAGLLKADITDSTMTGGTDADKYFAVWQATQIDRSKFEQMMIVEKYFRDMGYTINRKLSITNPPGTPLSTTKIDGDADTPEVQTINPGTIPPQSTYKLVVGTLVLQAIELSPSPSITELAEALKAAPQYANADFVISTSGSNLVLTWDENGLVDDTAALTYTTKLTKMKWEVLW